MSEVYDAIEQVRRKIGKIPANGINDEFQSNYMTLEDIYKKLDPVLAKNNLIVSQKVQGNTLKTRVMLSTTGDFIEDKLVMVQSYSMQQLGSAITYARRYSLITIFGLIDKSTDDDCAKPKKKKKE